MTNKLNLNFLNLANKINIFIEFKKSHGSSSLAYSLKFTHKFKAKQIINILNDCTKNKRIKITSKTIDSHYI